MTLAAIGDQVRIGIRLLRSLSARPFASRIAEVCREHAKIEEAINAGDSEAARQAMTTHLTCGVDRLFGR